MPYNSRERKCKQSSGKTGNWALVKIKPGGDEEQVSCHTSKEKANSAMRARGMNEDEVVREIGNPIEESKKITINESYLRQIIREELEVHMAPENLDALDSEEAYGLGYQAKDSYMDQDSRPTPTEEEFVDGPDRLAGYIVVRDNHDHQLIAHAPITQTDGPDRPFLVRTTDTKWHIPHNMVRLVYPGIEDVLNWVDSKQDWRGLGPGDRGSVGNFEWDWVEQEPS